MTRAVIYARYSSNNQRDASIEDQVRVCRERIEREGWTSVEVYSDAALSGATTLRPGYQSMLEAARDGRFDVLVSEALDRLSRDLSDIALLYKHLSFLGVQLVTLSEGEITDLHVGLKGTMNALYLKDLAAKTHRGLEGRIREGRSAGGISYGYDVVRETNAHGEPVRGKRAINEVEAKVVHRIFDAFVSGQSPKVIAHALNHEGVPGPRQGQWSPSTIYGNWRRGTGILNNELYVGRLIWNRQRFVKDPGTGKRVAQPNPKTAWITEHVPELRIIPDDLWRQVKERQSETRAELIQDGQGVRAERARRPVYLLSGLLKCSVCGGGVSKISAQHYGCSTARNRGTCDNLLTIRRDVLEESVLSGIKSRLMHPDLVKEFITEYHRELNRLAMTRKTDVHVQTRELGKVEQEIREIIDAIKAGIRSATMAAEIETLERRRAVLQKHLGAKPTEPVRLHPNLGEIYHRKVEALREALDRDDTRSEAATILRGLIDEIRLTPDDGQLGIYLVGNLAKILDLCAKKNPGSTGTGLQITLVAGARKQRESLILPVRL